MKLLKIGKWNGRFCHLIKAIAAEPAVENTTSKKQKFSWKFDTAFIGTVEFCQQCVSGFWSYSRGLIFTHWWETVLQQEISYSVSTAVITQKIVKRIRKDRKWLTGTRDNDPWTIMATWYVHYLIKHVRCCYCLWLVGEKTKRRLLLLNRLTLCLQFIIFLI